MELKLCQCCYSQQNLNILTARYAKILETIFSLKIESFNKCYVCNDCISVLIDTSLFRRKIERTQKAIEAKLFELKQKKQRISNKLITRTTETECTNKNVEKSNIVVSSSPKAIIKEDNSDSDDWNDDHYEVISDPAKSEALPPDCRAQERISVNDVLDQLDTETLICHICQEKQLSFTLLTRHMNVHYPNYICETCGKGFMTPSRLNSHTKIHNPVPSKCTVCGVTFANYNTMFSHRQTKHHVHKPNKCQLCGERFKYRYSKIKHLAEVHGQNEKNYKCHHCSMTFWTSSRRTTHFANKHQINYKHSCEVCGKSFSTKEKLRNHMTSHTTERPFQCGQCPKSYPRKNTLREHMRIHDNDKRFSCDVCGRRFTQKCSLKGHMKVHEKKGEKSENTVD